MSERESPYLPERRSVEVDVAILDTKMEQLIKEVASLKQQVSALVTKDNIEQGKVQIITLAASFIGAGIMLAFQLAWNYFTKGH
jgi:hypothetical protein